MVSSTGPIAMPWRRQHAHVVLDVLADLEDAGVLEQRLQRAPSGTGRRSVPSCSAPAPPARARPALAARLAMAERHVAARAAGAAQARATTADQLGRIGSSDVGLGSRRRRRRRAGRLGDPARRAPPRPGPARSRRRSTGAGWPSAGARRRPAPRRCRRTSAGRASRRRRRAGGLAELAREARQQALEAPAAPGRAAARCGSGSRRRRPRARPAAARRRAAAPARGEMRASSALCDQRLAALRLLDLAGARQQGLEIAIGR